MIQMHKYGKRDELIEDLSQQIADFVFTYVGLDGDVPEMPPTLLFSGGGTPKPLFERLAQMDPAPADYANVGLVDERCVPLDHPDSNHKLINTHLFADEPGFMRPLPLHIDGQGTAQTDELHGIAALMVEAPTFAVLGMGGDMHTASIFPSLASTAGLLAPNNPAMLGFSEPVDAPHKRITYTLAALMKADRLALHIEGNSKRDVFEAALEMDPIQAPIAAFLKHPSKTIEVYWCP